MCKPDAKLRWTLMNRRKELQNAKVFLNKHREMINSYFAGRVGCALYCCDESCEFTHDPERIFAFQLKRHLSQLKLAEVEKLNFSVNKYPGFRGAKSWDFEHNCLKQEYGSSDDEL